MPLRARAAARPASAAAEAAFAMLVYSRAPRRLKAVPDHLAQEQERPDKDRLVAAHFAEGMLGGGDNGRDAGAKEDDEAGVEGDAEVLQREHREAPSPPSSTRLEPLIRRRTGAARAARRRDRATSAMLRRLMIAREAFARVVLVLHPLQPPPDEEHHEVVEGAARGAHTRLVKPEVHHVEDSQPPTARPQTMCTFS